MTSLKITFLLPGTGHFPTGGSKVVYEYANRLSRRGHRVSLVHPALAVTTASGKQVARSAVSFVHRAATNGFRPNSWFKLDSGIRVLWVPSLSHRFIPDGDIVLATAWETAEWIVEYPEVKGDKFYLIQSWETWAGPEDRVKATWLTPLKKIVVARWLQELARELGVECSYIPNGIDFEQFGMDRTIEDRDPYRVMMLYHLHPVKGSTDGLDALTLVKKQATNLRVTLFGTPPLECRLPKWVEYSRLPSQRQLRAFYNQASIFLAPGRTEGWPLPPAEAMLCGAALVATDIGGHREYAVHRETALLSPPKDPEQLAENVLELTRSPELRNKIARRGHECIWKYSWEEAVNAFEHLLHERRLPEFRITPFFQAAMNGGQPCD